MSSEPVSLLPLAAALQRTGYSKTGLYEAIARGDAPRPIRRHGRSLWISTEIDALVKRQAETLPRAVIKMGRGMGSESSSA